MRIPLIIILKLSFLAFSTSLTAQISAGGLPPSFENPAIEGNQLKSEKIPAINLKKVQKEDEQHPGTTRFTSPYSVEFNLENSGRWSELENGDRIWQLKVSSRNALGLMFLYENFYLPPGAQLFMYNEDKSQVLGAYTSRNNKKSGHFMTGLIDGETAILEYYEPAPVLGLGRFQIFRVDRAYDRDNYENAQALPARQTGFGDSDPCNINVNCPEGQAFQTEKKSVCRVYLVVEEGIGFCSGALINNTAHDQTPYVLSAFHCQDGFTPLYDMWRFDFNYEAEDCVNPGLEPDFNSIVGCSLRAGWQASDFLLMELSTTIPNSYGVYYNGWDRTGVLPDTSSMIHHAAGDIKKVTLMQDAGIIYPTSISWNNDVTTPPNHHYWVICDVGFFQAGSSGAGHLDNNGRVIGQLHGHATTPLCNDSRAFFGRFSVSWDGGGTSSTRLRDWLDPENTGELFIEGLEPEMGATSALSGLIEREDGETIGGVEVTISGESTNSTLVTEMDGAFELPNLLLGGSYDLSLSKDMDDDNGVSTFDMVLITQHILGVASLDSPYKMLAADINDSGNISTFDVILIRRLILTLDSEFQEVPSWIFIPADWEFTNPADPFQDPIPATFQIDLANPVENRQYIGIKMGDVNNTASTN